MTTIAIILALSCGVVLPKMIVDGFGGGNPMKTARANVKS